MLVSGKYTDKSGFTLIEMSIVLIIIGLLIGGILTGQDLMKAAAARAQISQIEKYQTAMHTFQTKYGSLPGDIPNPYASQFGFQSRGTTPGTGDGNGVLDGIQGNNSPNYLYAAQGTGENAMFWVDLSAAGLIEGGFNTATPTTGPATVPVTGGALNAYFPQAKIGNGNYVFVWSGGTGANLGGAGYDSTWFLPTGINFFGVSAITSVNYEGDTAASSAISVNQAYSIDKKVDDGIPISGNVTIFTYDWANGTNVAVSGSSVTCADARGNPNGWNTVSTGNLYSVEINQGAGANCGLLIRFQ